MNIAAVIDPSCLKAETSEELVRALSRETPQYGIASACANGRWTPRVGALLKGSAVKAFLGATASPITCIASVQIMRETACQKVA